MFAKLAGRTFVAVMNPYGEGPKLVMTMVNVSGTPTCAGPAEMPAEIVSSVIVAEVLAELFCRFVSKSRLEIETALVPEGAVAKARAVTSTLVVWLEDRVPTLRIIRFPLME